MLGAATKLDDRVALYALFVLAVACLLMLCAVPRPLVPDTLPGFGMSSNAVDAVLAQDALDEKRAPRSPSAFEFERLFLAHGEAEDRRIGDITTQGVPTRELAAAYAAMVQQDGALAGIRMRARLLAKLEAALALRLPKEQVKGVMGLFADALAKHGVTRDGIEVAPHIVMRTLYKVRFNLAVQQAPDFALAEVERQAFRGWIAFRAEALRIDRRLTELKAYAKAATADAAPVIAEAEGVLLFQKGAYAEARGAMLRAHAATGHMRQRNYALAAELAQEREQSAGISGPPEQ